MEVRRDDAARVRQIIDALVSPGHAGVGVISPLNLERSP
jgi:hypothetical protein